MIQYFAFAKNKQGRIGQLIVTIQKGIKQQWTGKVYQSTLEAIEDTKQLNCKQA